MNSQKLSSLVASACLIFGAACPISAQNAQPAVGQGELIMVSYPQGGHGGGSHGGSGGSHGGNGGHDSGGSHGNSSSHTSNSNKSSNSGKSKGGQNRSNNNRSNNNGQANRGNQSQNPRSTTPPANRIHVPPANGATNRAPIAQRPQTRAPASASRVSARPAPIAQRRELTPALQQLRNKPTEIEFPATGPRGEVFDRSRMLAGFPDARQTGFLGRAFVDRRAVFLINQRIALQRGLGWYPWDCGPWGCFRHYVDPFGLDWFMWGVGGVYVDMRYYHGCWWRWDSYGGGRWVYYYGGAWWWPDAPDSVYVRSDDGYVQYQGDDASAPADSANAEPLSMPQPQTFTNTAGTRMVQVDEQGNATLSDTSDPNDSSITHFGIKANIEKNVKSVTFENDGPIQQIVFEFEGEATYAVMDANGTHEVIVYPADTNGNRDAYLSDLTKPDAQPAFIDTGVIDVGFQSLSPLTLYINVYKNINGQSSAYSGILDIGSMTWKIGGPPRDVPSDVHSSEPISRLMNQMGEALAR